MSDFARLIEKLRTLHAEGHLNSEASINLMIEHGSRIFRTGNMDDAETVFGDCVSRSVKHFGTVHEASMQAMTKLCEIYSANKRHDEANRIYQLYLRLLHSELASEYAEDLNKVQEVVEMWKKYAHEKDANCFSEFLHVLQINSASADPRVAIVASLNHTLSKVPSTSLEESHKIEEALKLCLQRAVERLGEDDEETITVRLHLATFLDEKMLRIADAEALYVQIIDQLAAKVVSPGEVNCLLLDVKVRYSRMLLKIGRAEPAFKLLQDLVAEKSDSASKRLNLLHRQARLLLAKGYADAGQQSDAVAVLEHIKIEELSDSLDDLRDIFVYHYVKDGQLPGPASPERLSVYEELHRCFRGKLGPDLANMAGNKWTASRLFALHIYAKLCTLVPAHGADAIPLFEALIRNTARVFGREHPFTLDVSIDEMEFHMYRLSVQDMHGYSDVARDIQQTIEKLRAKFGVEASSLSRSHEFQQKRAEFYLLMTDQTMNANGPTTAQGLVWYWKEKLGPESFETKRVSLFHAFLTISATSPLEGESALNISSPDPHAKAYLSVMSRKFLLQLVLRRIDVCRIVPNMPFSVFDELKGLYRVAVTLLRSLFGASAKLTRDVVEDAKKIFEKYDDHDMIDAVDEELLEALRMEHANLSEDKFSVLPEVRDLKAKIAANLEPARIAKLYQAAEGYRPQRNFARAEPLYRAAIRRRTKALGADAYETLVARNSYAVMLWNMQRYAEARYHLEEILQLRTRTSGETDSFTLRIEFNLSNIYKYQGRMDKAEVLYRHCLVGRRATLGDRQKETLNTLFYLAGVVASQHRYREAYTLYEECKALRTAAFGATNASVKEVDTAVTGFLAPGTVEMLCRNAQNAMGDKHHDYAAASELLTEALFLHETLLRNRGDDVHGDMHDTMVVQCARARRMAGSWSSLTLLTETFQSLRSRWGTTSQLLMQVAQELAHLQLLLRRRDGGAAPAMEVYQPLLESVRNSASELDRATFVRLNMDLANVLYDTCNFVEAEAHYRVVLNLISESSGLAVSIASSLSESPAQNVESQLALAMSAVGNRNALYRQAVLLRRAHRTKESDWCIAGEADLMGRMLLDCPFSSMTILPYRVAWVMPSQMPSTAEQYKPAAFAQPAEVFNKDTTSLIKFTRPILNTGPGSKEFEHPTLLAIAQVGERASRLSTQATGKPFEFTPPSWSSPTTTSSSSFSRTAASSSAANAFVFAPPPTIVQNNNPPPPPAQPPAFGGFGNSSGSSSGLFGNSNNNNNTNNNNSGGGLFGTVGNSTGSIGGGLFSGGSNNSNNNSGHPASSGGLFGGTRAPVGGSSGLFSSNNNNNNNNNNNSGGGLFGGSNPNGGFTAGGTSGPSGGGGGLFSSSSNNSNNNTGGGGLFGGTPSGGGGVFGQAPSTGGGLFSNSGNRPGGGGGGLFSSSTAPTGNLFGNNGTTARPFGAPAPGGFGMAQPSGSMFGANPTGSSNPSFSFGSSHPAERAPTMPDSNSTATTPAAGSGTRVDPRRISRSSHRRR